MINKRYMVLMGTVILGFVSVQAETYYLWNHEGGKSNDSWLKPDNWSLDGTEESQHATSFTGNHFVVPPQSSGYTLRTPSGGSSAAFSAQSLTLGGEANKKNNWAVIRHLTQSASGAAVSYENDGLFLADCSRYYIYRSNYDAYVKGRVTVTATSEEKPAQITCREPNTHLTFDDAVYAAASARMELYSETNGMALTMTDTSKFYGRLSVTNSGAQATSMLTLCGDFPGVLNLGAASVLKTAKDGKINALSVCAGATIDATAGHFAVTNEFVCEGRLRVVVNTPEQSLEMQPLLSLPAKSAISSKDVDFVLADGSPLVVDELKTVEGEGAMTFVAFVSPIVTLDKSDAPTKRTLDGTSAMTNGTQWSDGEWPTNALKAYRVEANKLLRTPANPSEPGEAFEFGGYALRLDGGSLYLNHKLFDARKLVLDNGGAIWPTPSCDGCIRASLVCDAGGGEINACSDRRWELSRSMSGTGTLKFTAPKGSETSSPSATFVLSGDNSTFTGGIVVSIPYYMPSDPVASTNKITPRFDRNFVRLEIGDKRNLGGPLETPDPKALTLANMSRLLPSSDVDSLVLDEPSRGLFVSWHGRLCPAAEQTLVFSSPLAVHGTLWKEGDGLLVLGNPSPTFGSDATSGLPDVDATNHMFRIAGGDVLIASADAVNGLNVVVENPNSRLLLDVGAADSDLLSSGIRNVKTDAPFAVEGYTGPLTMVLSSSTTPREQVVGIVTVRSSSAASVRGMLKVIRDISLKGFRVRLLPPEPVEVGGVSCAVIKASIERSGLLVVIK